ncbi:MAG: adenylyl-sulfate kinase [Gammaproteobacteria bacterium]|jgi:adenylylsulfate kinase|nr:adenylyl-sulfate kinase [Gammaproteobacteria bacterium]MBQ0774134.1 adenylyl-sulfate kinase [Gammaproteobacteria bacterium]
MSEQTSNASVVWHSTACSAQERAAAKRQRSACIWMTGLSASGKSTLANALEAHLLKEGFHTYLLDGDNVRHGLNRDLGMTDADRTENIRRVGEVARLMTDAGLIVITAFISPFRTDRDNARALFPEGEFHEVFVDAPLSICEARDPKGMYKKARAGVISEFTGIDSPYEAPDSPEARIVTGEKTIEQCVEQLAEMLLPKLQA